MTFTSRDETQAEHDRRRAEYMDSPPDRRGEAHHAFYCWLADFIGLTDNDIPATAAEVSASPDPHLNDIPLCRWDAKHEHTRHCAGRKLESWSQSDTVCCLKAIAKRRRDRAAAQPAT